MIKKTKVTRKDGGNDIEQRMESIEEAIHSACKRKFRQTNSLNNNSKRNSVPWWTTRVTTVRKKVNANRKLYHRTKTDKDLRERRKATYKETKIAYQIEIKKAKFISSKEYCNLATSTNP